MTSKRLAIVSTHPIQYHRRWFQQLASQPGLTIEVFYCHKATAIEQAEAGFGVKFDWDVSLLDGYPYHFLQNVAKQPGLAGFSGLDTPEMNDIIARERFDAVMINGWHYKSAWQTMLACWRTNTPVMVRSDSHLHTSRSRLKRTVKWPFYRWFVSKLDACLPVGKWSSDYFIHYGASPERVFIVPHAVDTDYFENESLRLGSQRTAIRRDWSLEDDAVVFLFVGKFIEKKRPMDFIRAIGEAKARGARVQGLMVGDGPLREACEDLIRLTGLPIELAGFLNQSQIARAYVAADALVLPSDGGETWGLVVNEAMACGLPCLVSDHVGCGPDMILDGENGAVFPMGDCDRLGEVLSTYADNPERLKVMGQRAKTKGQQYGVSAAVDGVLQAAESINT